MNSPRDPPPTEGGDIDLPASLRAAWGLPGRPTKGPKPGLSLDRIVEAAVDIAAAEGLAAVSMSRIATKLDSSPMSLYRYVAAKDELLALMVDAALGPAPAFSSPGDGWRAGLSHWAWAYHAVLRRHRWILRVPISGPPVTPNQTVWMERGLSSLADTGLSEGDKLSVILLLSGYVRNEATLVADLDDAAGTDKPEIMPTWGRQLRALTDPQRFPALHAALASEAFEHDDDPDDEFVFGLERILDGVDALVCRR
ncbi:MAG TPA: TetR/AcrR family transcriptional regulator [Aeromicrobium sp.]|nr:TetR/AcrR family transcriptional regulator [Aeromicrobium sp.]